MVFDFQVKFSGQIEYKSLLQFDCSSWIGNAVGLVIYVAFKSIFVKAQEHRALNCQRGENSAGDSSLVFFGSHSFDIVCFSSIV